MRTAGKTIPSPSRVSRAERSVESEAERGPYEHVVRVDIRSQLGAAEDVVPECELRAEVRVPIFTEYGDVLGEQPRDTRTQLHADRGVGVGLVRRLEVPGVFRVRYKDRRPNREVRLKLAVRKLGLLEERVPEHRVKPDHPDGEIEVIERIADAEARAERARLPADVRREVGDVQPNAEVEWTQVER